MNKSKIKSYDLPAIERARQIIEKNPTDHWIIPILADKAGINECKLKRGFKELYLTSPYKYLVKLRLEKAKLILEETDHTIQEIADRVGFESYKGFSLAFKNAFGILPSQYRKQTESFYINSLPNLIAS
jgi:AraC family transcriptional activator of pyochelin receptor